MAIPIQGPMSDEERAWMDEYNAIEDEIIAAAPKPLPGPLLVKLTIQRMAYRNPGTPRKEA